jgi:MoaA/NifB/PqqE/SkfB family radical SAM enzyme
MIGPDRLARVTAAAAVPEQVVAYVVAVAGSQPRMFADCVGYVSNGHLTLIGYPLHDPHDAMAMTAAVDEALGMAGLERITVIGPCRPPQAPAHACAVIDRYYALPLPVPEPKQKLRNLLKRATRELHIVHERRLRDEHVALVQRYLDERRLDAGTRHIFGQLGRYIETSDGSTVVSGCCPADGRLAVFAVGEFTPLATAFFMFCFRNPERAPPGSSDLMLSELLGEARRRGQTRMNLGLGVNAGIEFFKRKWGAEPFLPYVEVSWNVVPQGMLSRLRRRLTKAHKLKKKKETDNAEAFREPGFWESMRDAVIGTRRLLDCIQVEVTSRCSGRCTYCPHSIHHLKWLPRDMAMDTYERLWPLMRRSGRVHLQGWGEPLLHPDFFSMAALARRAGCQVSTTTCGLRMDRHMALRIVDSGIDIVAFSLAGTDAATNASRRGVDFERVCEAVSTLQAVRRERMGVHLEIHFAYLMLASNMAAVAGLPALMQRLGVHAAVISTLDYIGDPALKSEAFGPSETAKLAEAAAILSETKAEARLLGLDFHYELPTSEAFGTACRENIDRSLFISADGSVSPCVYVNVPIDALDPGRRIFGNVRETDPVDIWESADFRRFRERLAGGDPDLPCLSCPKRFMN